MYHKSVACFRSPQTDPNFSFVKIWQGRGGGLNLYTASEGVSRAPRGSGRGCGGVKVCSLPPAAHVCGARYSGGGGSGHSEKVRERKCGEKAQPAATCTSIRSASTCAPPDEAKRQAPPSTSLPGAAQVRGRQWRGTWARCSSPAARTHQTLGGGDDGVRTRENKQWRKKS